MGGKGSTYDLRASKDDLPEADRGGLDVTPFKEAESRSSSTSGITGVTECVSKECYKYKPE